MPLIDPSSYTPPTLFRSGHVQSIYPTLFRRVDGVDYERERLELPDGDFLDLDWSKADSKRIVLLLPGLASSSQSHYVRGMAKAFNKRSWDALAMNFRGCGGSPNRLFRSYHSGDTADLHSVIEHVFNLNRYDTLALVGFSMGGNVLLKYMGEQGAGIDARICGGAAVSAPCDLAASAERMRQLENIIYMRRFAHALRRKLRIKHRMFPGRIEPRDIERMKNFHDFDGMYTAPAHGFKDEFDYWEKSSSRPYLPRIARPTLLINARNDPFLAPESFPYEEARESAHFYFEAPRSGGHVGFVSFNHDGEYWLERRVAEFVSSLIP